MKKCIFCEIVAGAEPKHHVWESKRFVAFLDRNPVNPGHLLVVPKDHHADVFQMPINLYNELFESARLVEPTLRSVTGAKRIGVVIEGFGIDHVHLHMIPINHGNEIDPNRAKPANNEELSVMAEKIRSAMREKL